jgi:hypothetical protein
MVANRHAASLALALALVLVAGFVLMPRLNEMSSRAVAEGVQGFRARIDAMLGLSVSFDSLSPSILSSATFSGLSIRTPAGRTLLSARRVRVLYNLFAIARGRSSEAITGFELADVTLDLRLPEDEAILSRLVSAFSGSAGGGGDASLPRIVISGKNVVATLSADGVGAASFTAREAGLSTFEDEPVVTLDGRFSVEPSGAGARPISGPLSLSASISRDFARARANLALALDSRDFVLAMQRFELVYGNGELAITKVKDRAPLDAALRVSFSGGESTAALKLDGFVPARSVRVSGRFASLKPWLDIPYYGSVRLEAPGVDLARLRYDARLSGDLPAGLMSGERQAARAELAVMGDSREARIETARIERGPEFVEYKGRFRFRDLSPDGFLDLNLSLKNGRLPIAASLRLAGQGGEYAAMADRLSVGEVEFKDFALAARRKGSQADFKLSFLPPEPSAADEAASAATEPGPSAAFSGEAGASSGLPLVRCEGSFAFGSDPGLELSIDLDSVDLGPMKSLIAELSGSAEASALLSDLKLGGGLFVTSDLQRLSWSAPDMTIVSRTSPGTYALLALSGTMTSVSVKKAVVSISGKTIEGQGRLDFEEAGRLSFEAKVEIMDFPFAFQGSVDGGDVTIAGDYGLQVSSRDLGGAHGITLRARALPLPVMGSVFLATIDADGRYAGRDDWFLSVSDLSLVPAGERASSLPKIEASGDFGPKSASLSSLRISDRYSSVSGDAAVSYSLREPLSAKLSARLSSPASPKARSALEAYRLELSYSEGRIAGAVDLTASPLARLGKLPVSGFADGKLGIRGELSDPLVDFTLSLREGRLGDQSLALSSAGSYGRGVVSLRDLSAAYQGNYLSGGSASFSLRDASAELAMSFSGVFNDESLKFDIAARGVSSAIGQQAALADRLGRYELSGSMARFSLGGRKVDRWPFKLTNDRGTVTLVGGPAAELRFKYASGGVISASIHKPLPILPLSAEVAGLYNGTNIDLSIQGIDFDLAALQPLMPQKIIRLSAGRARGGFRAIGLAKDPEISGEIDVTGASVKVIGWVGDEIGPFNVPIVALGRRIEASVPAAPSGKGSVAIGFQAVVDHWLPTGIKAFACTTPGTAVRLDSVILGINATGEAAADVRFAYPGGDTLRIDADVTMRSGSVVVSTETLATAGGSGAIEQTDVMLDVGVNIRFERGVQVFFPSTSFPIVAGYSDPSSSLAVLYNQASSDFSLKGTVALRGGEAFYVQRNFFLKSGKIVFNEGSDRFDPRVTLLAELRDRNEAGPVRITLKAENAPLATFKPTLSSDPVMSEAEIAALMGQSVFGTEGEKGVDFRKTAISASEFIPQLNVTRVLENRIRDAAGFDIFYLRTQVLQNWLIDMSQSKAENSENPLARYMDRSSVYAGKYLNDSIFAYGSMGVREATPLVGSTTSIINYELGVELDAPFGRLTWALAPEDWKTLKFRDQSLSLSWKLSY